MKHANNGWIRTLFLWILKSSRDFRNFRNFTIWSLKTLTRFCGNTVCCIRNLTGPSEREPRDLGVYNALTHNLWRLSNMAMMGVFLILLDRSNQVYQKSGTINCPKRILIYNACFRPMIWEMNPSGLYGRNTKTLASWFFKSLGIKFESNQYVPYLIKWHIMGYKSKFIIDTSQFTQWLNSDTGLIRCINI